MRLPTDAELADRYRVTNGSKFKLKDCDPADSWGLDKAQVEGLLVKGVQRLSDLQERLYAQDRWSVLLMFQAMDAAGKDSTIKQVMSGVNPQGCEVHAFKAPSVEELDHDFLWRTSKVLPPRGHIGIFNRSYYEETLVVRVHQEILAKQQLPPSLVTKNIWNERHEDIAAFEKYLARQGVVVCKFFLHVSPEEQKKRFLERLEEPEKNWKFSLSDLNERDHFGDYMKYYEEAIRQTAAPWAPWYVIPADRKWFAHIAVSAAINAAIEKVQPAFPTVSAKLKQDFKKAKAALKSEGKRKK